MKEFEFVIRDQMGIHARPAARLVYCAAKFESELRLIYDGEEGDLKKPFSIMKLAVGHGGKVCVRANGADEDAAIATLAEFFEQNL